MIIQKKVQIKFIVLCIVICIQLIIPLYIIFNKYHILKTGKEVYFRVKPVDPYDAFRGRYVTLSLEQSLYNVEKNGILYAIIDIDEDGFAYITEITNNIPQNNMYIKSKTRKYFLLPLDRYYMDEKLAPKAEKVVQNRDINKNFKDVYVSVRIINGETVISGLFVDGKSIEDIVR